MTAASMGFPADLEALPAINEWLQAQGESFAISPAVAFKMELCVEEIVTNTVKYGLAGDGTKVGWIEIGVRCWEGGLELRIADNAPPFNPLQHKQRTPPTSLESAPIGGLGILLVREIAKAVHYDRVEEANVLTIQF